MALKVIIRSPRENEKQRFYEVFQSGLPGVDKTTFETFSRWWKGGASDGSLERLWRIAEVQGEIVGIVCNDFYDALNWGIVWELAVLPEWRGKGVGAKLLSESEKLLKSNFETMNYFALGVKVLNHKAVRFYERYGYSIRFLVLNLRGAIWEQSISTSVKARKAASRDVASLLDLIPCAYWSKCSKETWERVVERPRSYVVVSYDAGEIIGHFRLKRDEEDKETTQIDFSFKSGFGITVLDAAINFIQTKKVDLWIQDAHQHVIDHLYKRGLELNEAEFLMKKPVKNRQ